MIEARLGHLLRGPGGDAYGRIRTVLGIPLPPQKFTIFVNSGSKTETRMAPPENYYKDPSNGKASWANLKKKEDLLEADYLG